MILSFADRETRRLWEDGGSRRLPSEIARAAANKLALLDAALTLDDLRNPPGNRLEALSGDRAGQYSLRVNRQWRVVFRWSSRGAEDVEIVDYH